MKTVWKRDLVAAMAGLMMLLAPVGCRKTGDTPAEEQGRPAEADGGRVPARVDPVVSGNHEPSKRARNEGRTPDGRPAAPKWREGIPIPGKPGFVFNPFTNNPVDVRGLPPGTLVRDPQDPDPTHKFRVPKETAPAEGKE